MLPHETEVSPMVSLSVGFYDRSDNPKLAARIAAIKLFLLAQGGTCQVIQKIIDRPNADLEIEFLATIPQAYADQHHTFDSVLNSTTRPDGFGVAWVERKTF